MFYKSISLQSDCPIRDSVVTGSGHPGHVLCGSSGSDPLQNLSRLTRIGSRANQFVNLTMCTRNS